MHKNYKAIIFPLKTEAAAIRKMIQDIVKLNRSFVLYPVSVFLMQQPQSVLFILRQEIKFFNYFICKSRYLSDLYYKI